MHSDDHKYRDDSHETTHTRELLRQTRQLHLQRCELVATRFNHGSHASEHRVRTHRHNHHRQRSLVALRGRHDEGVLGSLLDLVRLARQLRLVHLDVVSREVDAIGGNRVSGRDLHNVAHNQIVNENLGLVTVANDSDITPVVLRIQHAELLVLLEVVDSRYVQTDKDGNNNRTSVKASCRETFRVQTEGNGNNR